jgi:MFS family permease
MVGSLFVWLSDWQGRKRHIFIGATGTLVGTILTSTAKTVPVFIGGRFVLAYFATLAHTGAILYLVEIAPTRYRGTLAGRSVIGRSERSDKLQVLTIRSITS